MKGNEMLNNIIFKHFPVLLALAFTSQAFAVTVSDDFTQADDTNNWVPLGVACLTAGTAANNSVPTTSNIPGCNYGSPDSVGSGALRLTPASGNQTGAIVSSYTFPSNQGLQATFTTYTYGGDTGGTAGQGADGMLFFLQDGSVGTSVGGGSNIGAFGGSLGYSCSSGKGAGLTGAYLGLGMDEYGNFLNSGDNSADGIPNTNRTSAPYPALTQGTNTWSSSPNSGASSGSGGYYQPNRIGLRGAGNVSGYWLNASYPDLYPSSTDNTAVENTCGTALIQNGHNGTQTYPTTALSWSAQVLTITVDTTQNPLNLRVGDTVNITASGSAPTVGGVPIPSQYTISSLAWSGNVLTITTSSSHGLAVGNTVTIGGSVADSNLVALNSSYVITSVPTTTTFTVALASNPGTFSNVSSGTVSSPYVVTSVDKPNKKFTIAFGASGNSGAILNAGNGRITINVMDYPAIPLGYWVLPNSQKIANVVGTPTRANSWPITYRLQITPAGLLTFMYSYNGGTYQSVLSNWPITTGNGPLPSTFRFGFTGSTGGSNNNHEITCFEAEPLQASSSAGANTVQAGQVRTGTQVYLASYNPNNWSGSLVSEAIVNNSGTLSVATVADWDGNCVLTGGGCPTMGTTAGVPNNTITVEAPSSRQLLTWSGSAGIPLEWASGITSTQQTDLNSTDSNGQIRLNWLRGDRTQEQTTGGPLRVRGGVLGDIIDSSPTWVGAPAAGYAATFTDLLYGAGSETSYPSFATSMVTRQNVVYAGSNDGLLHGFRTGSNNTDGSYNSTNNDGYEVIGYMPSTVLANANVVLLTNPTYQHNYFVDATPGTGDLFYNNAWHTWLVGGLGAGGAEIYALDITDPTGLVTSTSAYSESNAANLVKGDWTSSTLTCSTVSGVAVSGCGNNLGNTYGTPLIRRLHNGQWAIIFGNGLGSSNHHAGVFIGLVNASSGAITFYWLDTGAGSSSTPDGISYVSSADLDGDHVTDYLYAGDLLGNVWRFDLTSSNIADWGVSKFGQPSAAPLFTAKDGSGNVQPITTKIAVTATTTGGAQRVLLGFGTGQETSPQTWNAPAQYLTTTQTVYGVWDWDMTLWNSGTITANSVHIPASSIQYATLAEVTSSPYRTFARANLLANSVATETATTRTVAISTVCWQGSTACSSGNTQYGWLFDLPDSHEQIIYSPIFSGGELFVNTTIPPVTTLGQCSPSLPTGWTMAFNMASGGGNVKNVFPDSSGSLVVASGNSSITGVKQNGVGTPWVVSIGSQQNIVTQTNTGNAAISKINPGGGVTVKRISWEELR